MTDHPTEYAFTGALEEIAHLIGVDQTMVIARVDGGRVISIPQKLTREHHLVQLVGWKAAQLIQQHFGHGNLKLPSARPYLRWLDARRLRRQGKSLSQISSRLGITKRRVEQLLEGFDAGQKGSEAEAPVAQICPACGHKRPPVRQHAPGDDRQGVLPI